MGLIEKSDHDRINKVLPVCEMAIKLCGNLIDFSYLLFEKSRACLICHSCKVDILLFKIGFDIDLLTILVHCHIFCLFVILASLPMQMLQCPFFLFFFQVLMAQSHAWPLILFAMVYSVASCHALVI